MSGVLNLVSRLAIPAAVGVSLFQLSIYDVKGGSRAVIFDRLTGVKENVCAGFPIRCCGFRLTIKTGRQRGDALPDPVAAEGHRIRCPYEAQEHLDYYRE